MGALLGKTEMKAFLSANMHLIGFTMEQDNLELFQYLSSFFTNEEIKHYLIANNYSLARKAIERNVRGAFQILESYLNNTEITKTFNPNLSTWIPTFLRSAYNKTSENNIDFLLKYNTLFSYIEQHSEEYDDKFTRSYVNRKLAELQAAKASLEANGATATYDVDETEAQHYFYILRYFIRRSELAGSLEKINLLLSMPSVTDLCHQDLAIDGTSQENELLRLAIGQSNIKVIERLLQIPNVRSVAAKNNFYQDKVKQTDIDLNHIIKNEESSMKAISQPERRMLQEFATHFQEKINSLGGIDAAFECLVQDLKSGYEKNPATISINKKGSTQTISLPVSWEEFQKLNLKPNDYKKALKAYYQHSTHTALRFLSIPNPWIAKDAAFVIPHSSGYSYASFSHYKNIIALLYIAAKYTNPSSGSHAEAIPENDIDHYIHSLASIGRAHNWDKSRTKLKRGKLTTEEYDDLAGDKPSCGSGVLSRLISTFTTHPLVNNILTDELIRSHLRDFIKESIKNKIDRMDSQEIQGIQQAYERYLIKLDESTEITDRLKVFNLTEEEQRNFIELIKEKYPNEIKLVAPLLTIYSLLYGASNDDSELLIATHGDLVELDDLLSQSGKLATAATPAKNPCSLFSNTEIIGASFGDGEDYSSGESPVLSTRL